VNKEFQRHEMCAADWCHRVSSWWSNSGLFNPTKSGLSSLTSLKVCTQHQSQHYATDHIKHSSETSAICTTATDQNRQEAGETTLRII